MKRIYGGVREGCALMNASYFILYFLVGPARNVRGAGRRQALTVVPAALPEVKGRTGMQLN
jgi:hypothetical protein